MYQGANIISPYVSDNTSRQISAMEMCERIMLNTDITNVIDLGCGRGDSIDNFLKIEPNIYWTGVDIEDSPEVKLRTKEGKNFITFDGINIPFSNKTCDLILCIQVLEHVERPRELLRDAARVLKTGGYLVGSTSHLEAFHGLSCWNYTPYGMKLLLEEAGFIIKEMRSGIDAITLFSHRFLRRIPLADLILGRYFKHESPFNRLLGFGLKLIGKKHRDINLWKLLFCGHFVFLAMKK